MPRSPRFRRPALRVPPHPAVVLLAVGSLLFGCSPAPLEETGAMPASRETSSPGTPARSQAVAVDVIPAAERARLAARAGRVEILRDDFGVPHIYAKTDADAVFGLLYAQAEDDFPRIERNYVWAIGRLAEVEGESALYSDLRARLYMTRAEAEAAYAAAPAWLQALCDAFADGLNHYLATHPETTPKLLRRFEAWMPFYFFEGSIGGDIEQIPLAGIEAFHARGDAVLEGLPTAAAAALPWQPAGVDTGLAGTTIAVTEPLGSNGFAIAPARTRDGHALLLINPHTSFYFRGEVHVVSEEGLNAYGAVTWGQFFVYQGFNEDTGWMHTSTRVDFMDEFVLDVRRLGDELVYRFGDEFRPVQERTVELQVAAEDGMQTRTFRTWHTHQGPVTHALDGRWVATRINWNAVDALRQSYLRMKTDGYPAFREMMDIRTNSSNNTVFADSSGNIAYFHGNFVPRRDPARDWSRPVDGSDPGTDWQGVHAVDETVTLLNPASGWLQNANSTPFTAAGASSPRREDYPVYMAPDAENHRGIHAVEVLRDATDLTLDGLIELAYDPWLPGMERLIDGLLEAWENTSGEARRRLAAPMAALQLWDRRVAMDSVGMTLAHFYGINMLESVEAPAGLTRMERIDWMGTDAPAARRLEVFTATIEELERKFAEWRVPWGEVNRFQRLDGAIEQRFDDFEPSVGIPMASGNWGALASFGAPRRDDVDRLYGRYGNSFVAVVEFADRVRAKSLLAGGQSGDPESPHFDDQVVRYRDVEFKPVAYYREDVERRAQRRYRPGLGALPLPEPASGE